MTMNSRVFCCQSNPRHTHIHFHLKRRAHHFCNIIAKDTHATELASKTKKKFVISSCQQNCVRFCHTYYFLYLSVCVYVCVAVCKTLFQPSNSYLPNILKWYSIRTWQRKDANTEIYKSNECEENDVNSLTYFSSENQKFLGYTTTLTGSCHSKLHNQIKNVWIEHNLSSLPQILCQRNWRNSGIVILLQQQATKSLFLYICLHSNLSDIVLSPSFSVVLSVCEWHLYVCCMIYMRICRFFLCKKKSFHFYSGQQDQTKHQKKKKKELEKNLMKIKL